jgi:hypothetical protein
MMNPRSSLNINKEINNVIEGQNVDLFPINLDHFPLYLKWQNDLELREFNCNRGAFFSVDQLKREMANPRPAFPDSIMFEIWYKPENKLAGYMLVHGGIIMPNSE